MRATSFRRHRRNIFSLALCAEVCDAQCLMPLKSLPRQGEEALGYGGQFRVIKQLDMIEEQTSVVGPLHAEV